jgi:uncharacterized membrane protein YdfJ with MMPL/SSD domain
MKRYRNDRGQGFLMMQWVRRHPIASIFGVWVILIALAGLSTATLVHTSTEATGTESAGTEVAGTEVADAEVAGTEAKMTALPEGQTEPTPVFLTQHAPEMQDGQSMPLISFGAIAVSCTLGCLLLSQVVRPAPRPAAKRLYQSRSTALGRSAADSKEGATSDSAVTVVPAEQNHPLDWDEPSLADSLDLRQRRPLSHWLS